MPSRAVSSPVSAGQTVDGDHGSDGRAVGIAEPFGLMGVVLVRLHLLTAAALYGTGCGGLAETRTLQPAPSTGHIRGHLSTCWRARGATGIPFIHGLNTSELVAAVGESHAPAATCRRDHRGFERPALGVAHDGHVRVPGQALRPREIDVLPAGRMQCGHSE